MHRGDNGGYHSLLLAKELRLIRRQITGIIGKSIILNEQFLSLVSLIFLWTFLSFKQQGRSVLIHLGKKIDSREKRKEESVSGFWFLVSFFMGNRKDSWTRKTIGETK